MDSIEVIKVPLAEIGSLRALFLQEANFQVRYNACHERGWTDSYLLTVDTVSVGYGAIKGQEIVDRDTVFEFYLIPAFAGRPVRSSTGCSGYRGRNIWNVKPTTLRCPRRCTNSRKTYLPMLRYFRITASPD